MLYVTGYDLAFVIYRRFIHCPNLALAPTSFMGAIAPSTVTYNLSGASSGAWHTFTGSSAL